MDDADHVPAGLGGEGLFGPVQQLHLLEDGGLAGLARAEEEELDDLVVLGEGLFELAVGGVAMAVPQSLIHAVCISNQR